jgi:hypothetical protein
MRSLILAVGSVVAALALGTGGATASPAQPFHGDLSCQQVSETRTICFEAWGVSVPQESGDYVSLAHRRFTEYTSGVLTFEQTDTLHHVIHLDASGAEQVSIASFSGWSTTTGGFMCRWRDHLVVIDGEVVYSVDQFACETA